MTRNKYATKPCCNINIIGIFIGVKFLKFLIFYFLKQMEFSVLKRLSFISKPTYQNFVREFHNIHVADRVGVVIYKC